MTFLERASEAIREAGGRMTDQRQTIISLLADAPEFIDAETLYQRARSRNPQINLTTVYRTLDVLEAAELIRAQFVSPDHERKYFSLTRETYHFICRRCHRVIPFSSRLIEDLKQQLTDEFSALALNVCVCVEGLCLDCQAATPHEESR